MTGNRLPLINGHGLALACSEVSFRRLDGEEHLTFLLWGWTTSTTISCENEDSFRKKKNWLKIHEMLDLKIESSKTAGEQWLFKYQYSIFYSLTNKKCGFVENRMVINSCGMMGLVTWFKWRLKKRKSRVKMEAEGTKHLTLMSKIGMQLD